MERGKKVSRGQLVISAAFLRALRKATFLCGNAEQRSLVFHFPVFSSLVIRVHRQKSLGCIQVWSGFGDAESTCWPCSWGHVRLKSFSLTPPPQLSAAGVNLHGQAAPLPPEACHLLDFLSFCNVRFITFSLMCNYGH